MVTVTKQTQVKIDGTDVTSDVMNWDVLKVIENFSGELTLVCRRGLETTLGSVVEDANIIQVYRGSVATPTLNYVFKGRINNVEYDGLFYTIHCYDMLHDLVLAEVTYSYDSALDPSVGVNSAIVEDLITTHGGMTASVTTSSSANLITRYTCYYDDVLERCEKLSKILGWHLYYQASDDTVYYEPKGTTVSGITLAYASADYTSNILKKPKWKYDRDNLCNWVTILGVTNEIETTETFNGDTVETDFALAYIPISVKIFVDTVLQTGGMTDETTTFDYQIDKHITTPLIKFTTIPDNGTDNIEVRYSHAVKAPVIADSEESYTKFDNTWYKQKIDDVDFENVADATEFAQKYIDTYSDYLIDTTELEISTDEFFEAGQSVQVVDGSVGENRQLMIKEVKIRWPNPTDLIKVGETTWRIEKWMLNIEQKLKELEKEEKRKDDIVTHIKRVKTQIAFTKDTFKTYTQKIYDMAIGIAKDIYHPNALADQGESIDDMLAVGNWIGTNGANNFSVATDSGTKQVGANSLKLTWSGWSSGAGNFTDATTSQGDLSAYTGQSSGTPTQGTVGFWLNLTAATDITGNINLKLGSSSGNYTLMTGVEYASTQNYGDETATWATGWNYVMFKLPSGTETGTPDWTAVDYIDIEFNLNTTAESMYIDYLTISKSDVIALNGAGGDRRGSEVAQFSG